MNFLMAAAVARALRNIGASGGGGGGGAAPLILYTDITAGPVSGGENDKGCYLSIYGLNLGTFSDYGTTNFVTIGGVNVDNYRCLQNAVGNASPAVGNSVFGTWGIKRLTVQVGALTGLSAGTAYPISVTIDGTPPANNTSGGNNLDVFGETLMFTPQPGSIVFVATTGSDGAAGTIAAPLLNLQSSTGFAGALKIASGANATDGTHPGTHVILRGGTYTASGLNNRWVDLFRITGTSPTGATDRGPIVITSYPGAAGADAPETVVWQGASGAGGGFNGNDSTRAGETSTAYGGFTGWCQYIHISNLKVSVNAGSGDDAGPFNTQAHGQYWRIVNCDATWPSTVVTPQAFSAGIEGSPVNGRFYGNYLHDIDGAGAEANTNHGIYLNGFGSGAGNVANGNIIAFNIIRDIGQGSGISVFDGVNGAGIRNNTLAYNWVQNVNRCGVNISDNTESMTVYNNVFIGSGEQSIRVSTSGLIAANGIYVFNNTCYGWASQTGAEAFISASALGAAPRSMRIENNIFMQTPSHAANGYDFVTVDTGTITFNDNQWYDPDGRLTAKPAADSAGAYGNPLFTAAASNDFTLQAGSPCLNVGTTPLITRAYAFALDVSAFGAAIDRGAYEKQT